MNMTSIKEKSILGGKRILETEQISNSVEQINIKSAFID